MEMLRVISTWLEVKVVGWIRTPWSSNWSRESSGLWQNYKDQQYLKDRLK